MAKVITFNRALKLTKEANKRHVLLGNGFSIACRADIFQYGKLFDRADFKGLGATARAAFKALKTTDFEIVMRALRHAAELATVYAKKNPDLATRMLRDADGLREVRSSWNPTAMDLSYDSTRSRLSDKRMSQQARPATRPAERGQRGPGSTVR